MSYFRLTVVVAALALSACAANDPYQRTKTGAAIGAVTGAILGHQLDGNDGRYVGAAVGAAIGGGVGYTLDQQQRELEALAAENRQLGLEVERLSDGSLRLDIPSEVSFDFDSAVIRPEFRSPLNQVADIVSRDTRSDIRIIGHTDSTGSERYNYDLSQKRAESVADFLARRGVSPRRLYPEGRGERDPVASNETAFGRQQNRRVELFIMPV